MDDVYYSGGFSERMTYAEYTGISRVLCYAAQRKAGWTKKP